MYKWSIYFIPGLDEVEEPSPEHKVRPAHEVARPRACHQADDQRSAGRLGAEDKQVSLLQPWENPIDFIIDLWIMSGNFAVSCLSTAPIWLMSIPPESSSQHREATLPPVRPAHCPRRWVWSCSGRLELRWLAASPPMNLSAPRRHSEFKILLKLW